MLYDVTNDNFDEIVKSNELVILDFYADWCGPCKMFKPVFEAVSSEYPEIGFAKVNVENANRVAAKFGVRSIPTVVVLHKGEEVFNQPGMMRDGDLRHLVDQYKTL